MRYLLQLHVSDKSFEIRCIDLVPQRFLPGLELAINQSNQVPHLFELDQFTLAVFDLLVVGSLQIEQSFQVLQLFGLVLDVHRLAVVLRYGVVRLLDDLG